MSRKFRFKISAQSVEKKQVGVYIVDGGSDRPEFMSLCHHEAEITADSKESMMAYMDAHGSNVFGCGRKHEIYIQGETQLIDAS